MVLWIGNQKLFSAKILICNFLRFFLLQAVAVPKSFTTLNLTFLSEEFLKKLCTLDFEMFGFSVFTRTTETAEHRTQLSRRMADSVNNLSIRTADSGKCPAPAALTLKIKLVTKVTKSSCPISIHGCSLLGFY